MLKRLTCATFMIVLASTASFAGPIGWQQQPYFTYSPGAVAFEDIEWTPLEFAAFSAYGGYFANIRRPLFETPVPQLVVGSTDFVVEDEIRIALNTAGAPTFMPQVAAFSNFSIASEPMPPVEDVPVPEPGILALVGSGLLLGSRTLRRRLRR